MDREGNEVSFKYSEDTESEDEDNNLDDDSLKNFLEQQENTT